MWFPQQLPEDLKTNRRSEQPQNQTHPNEHARGDQASLLLILVLVLFPCLCPNPFWWPLELLVGNLLWEGVFPAWVYHHPSGCVTCCWTWQPHLQLVPLEERCQVHGYWMIVRSFQQYLLDHSWHQNLVPRKIAFDPKPVEHVVDQTLQNCDRSTMHSCKFHPKAMQHSMDQTPQSLGFSMSALNCKAAGGKKTQKF